MKLKNNYIKSAIMFLVGITLVFILMNFGYERSMKVYCNNLLLQAEENKDNQHYYITKIDYYNCKNAYDINILTTVK